MASLAGVTMKTSALGLCLLLTFCAARAAVRTEAILPAGTAISVKLADSIDSDRDPYGKQYAASIAIPIDVARSHTIAAGSPATVVLLHNNSGWLPQLATVTIDGKKFKVTSSAGMLITSGPKPANAPNLTLATLKELGGPAAIPAGAPLPSGQRVRLPAATELRFILIGTADAAPVIRAASRHTASTKPAAARAISKPAEEAGVPYLCRANDTPDRGVPITYYIADVFETRDDPAQVEKRWFQYLVTTYPYRFAHSSRSLAHCTRLEADTFAQGDPLDRLQQEWRSENAQVIQTRWHYRIGPPPSAAMPPRGSSLP
jgi:hypothetical protein